jgi:hypothetical protein
LLVGYFQKSKEWILFLKKLGDRIYRIVKIFLPGFHDESLGTPIAFGEKLPNNLTSLAAK